jgi:hypothetical protein
VSTRNSQIVSSGLGRHFVSPQKVRDKKKTQTLIELPGAQAKRRRLLAVMEDLMNPEHQASKSPAPPAARVIDEPPDPGDDCVMDDVKEFVSEEGTDFTGGQAKSKRRIPDNSINTLYSSWSSLIPTLVEPQVKYYARTRGQPLERTHEVISACATLKCESKRTTLICLYFDRKRSNIAPAATFILTYA